MTLAVVEVAAMRQTVSDHPALWPSSIACKRDPDLFFPEFKPDARAAQLVCRECPLLARCAAWALNDPVPVPGSVVAGVHLPGEFAGEASRERARAELARIAAGGTPKLAARKRGEPKPIAAKNDPEFLAQVLEMHAAGMSFARIGRLLNVSGTTASRATFGHRQQPEDGRIPLEPCECACHSRYEHCDWCCQDRLCPDCLFYAATEG